MSNRREKAKAQNAQLNRQLEQTDRESRPKTKTWETNLGKYLLDVSKYVLTGVVITSLFKDVTDKTLVYSKYSYCTVDIVDRFKIDK